MAMAVGPLARVQLDGEDPVSVRDLPAAEVYTVRQVAALLGINLGGAYELIRTGRIPAKRLGKRWIVPRRAFHDWLNAVD